MRTLFTLCLFGLSMLSFAQHKTHTWFFADSLGLQFDQATPKIRHDGITHRAIGPSVICDDQGQLLFYTDGQTVWNRKHMTMANGTDLLGYIAAKQAALILHRPGTTLYYIFTSGVPASSPDPAYGTNYSVVDLSKDNGLGAVVQKNILLSRHSLGAVSGKRVNDTSYCIAVHEWYKKELQLYRLSSSGLTLMTKYPMESNAIPMRSQMKFSPNGRHLAYSYWKNRCHHRLYLLKMDLPHYTIERVNYVDSIYTSTIEFSPNGQWLYAVAKPYCVNSQQGTQHARLYRFNIDSIQDWGPSRFPYPISMENLDHSLMTMTPFHQIFICTSDPQNGDTKMHAILHPDRNGEDCGFHLDHISLPKRYRPFYGAPNICIDYTLTPQLSTTEACKGEEVRFQLSRHFADSLYWIFGDGQQARGLADSIVHRYQQAGMYTAQCVLWRWGYKDTLRLNVRVRNATPAKLPSDTTLCADSVLHLHLPTQPDELVSWSSGQHGPEVSLAQAGSYKVLIQNGQCTATHELHLHHKNCECPLYMPNAFSPNADGINEDFGPHAPCGIDHVVLRIYNRWGACLYQGPSPWNGMYLGSPCPTDVYVWTLSYMDHEGILRHSSGNLHLLR